MAAKLDVIIFGASGFSGKYVVEEFLKLTKKERKLTWGIAGRCETKLKKVLEELQQKTGENLQNVAIFKADTKNPSSLATMASTTRLVINCTGPYKFHGEPVIQACIQEKCHYIDITAEPQFMERVQLVYNENAGKSGVFVVTSCGIDNIPADMGLDFVRKRFDGTLNSVECYQEVVPDDGFGNGAVANYGTWQSFVYTMVDYDELKEIRKKLFPKRLPKMEPELKMRHLHKIPFSPNHAGPYPGGEATVMRRSQRHFFETKKTRPIQIHTYAGSPKFWHYIILFVAFMMFLLLLKLKKFTLKYLLQYPKHLTLGFFDFNPNKETISKLNITSTFYGKGWKGKVVDEKYKEVEDSWIVAKVKGRDPYVVTGVCAAAAAVVLLDGSQKFPEKKGVYTTSGVFRDTNLVEVLQRNGLKFEVEAEGGFFVGK